MNPESIEKTPDGFTDKVMSAVRVESLLGVKKKERAAGIIVPVSVLALMVILVIISALTGNSDNATFGSQISKVIQNLALPQIKSPVLPGLNLPALAIYISLGTFVLWIFDLFLGKLFYRKQ